MEQNDLYFLGENPTADCVIFQNNKVLLIQRSKNSPACPNMWAIPGGFINSKSKKGELFVAIEDSKTAAIREFFEETGLDLNNNDIIPFINKFAFIDIFQGNNRDPRDNNIGWTKSFAWLFVIDDNFIIDKFNLDYNEVSNAQWFDLDNLPILAFDHNLIIDKAKTILNIKNKKLNL